MRKMTTTSETELGFSAAIPARQSASGGTARAAQPTDIDSLLMLQVAREDSESALRTLIDKWKNPLVSFVYASTRDFQLAEDIAITVFRKLYNARESYRAEAKFSTFLFRIAHNEIITEYRKRQARPAETDDIADIDLPAPSDSGAKLRDIEEAFAAAVDKIPSKQREAITLLVRNELPYAEIADIMGESVASVKTLVNRARARLRESMKDYI